MFHKQLYETTVLKPLNLQYINRQNITSSFVSPLTIITFFCNTTITKGQQKEPQKLKSTQTSQNSSETNCLSPEDII